MLVDAIFDFQASFASTRIFSFCQVTKVGSENNELVTQDALVFSKGDYLIAICHYHDLQLLDISGHSPNCNGGQHLL